MAASQELIHELNHVHPWDLAETLTAGQAEALLAEKINALIRDDFSGLVQLLYRIDVDEIRLRQVLQDNKEEDAGKIIARLIIGRLIKKIEARKQFGVREDNIPEEDKW